MDDCWCGSLEDCRGGPEVDAALVGSSLELEEAVDTPLAAPTVLDSPVVLILRAVPNKDEGVVGPGGTQARIGHSALVVHHPREVQQNRQRPDLEECILDDGFIVGEVHVPLDLHLLLQVTRLAGARVVRPQRVVLVVHESPVLGQPIDSLIGPSAGTSFVGLIAVDQLLFRESHKSLAFASQVVQTLDVSSSAEGPAGTATTLVLYWPHCPLLLPVPNIRRGGLRLVVGVVREVRHEGESGECRDIEPHKVSGFGKGEVSEPGLAVDGVIVWIGVEEGDFSKVFEVDGETVVFDCLGLVPFVVLDRIALELVVVFGERGCCQACTEQNSQSYCQDSHRLIVSHPITPIQTHPMAI